MGCAYFDARILALTLETGGIQLVGPAIRRHSIKSREAITSVAYRPRDHSSCCDNLSITLCEEHHVALAAMDD